MHLESLKKLICVFFVLIVPCFTSADVSSELLVEGDDFEFQIYPQETVQDVVDKIGYYVDFSDGEEVMLLGRLDPDRERIVGFQCVANKRNTTVQKQPIDVKRDYSHEFTVDEKNDLTFIVTTLANGSFAKIVRNKSALEKAGDRIDHVHPFKFVMEIFNDERLKVGLHVIKTRGWLWKDFFGGIKGSMTAESRLNNVLEHVNDFASRVGIDPAIIYPSLVKEDWSGFIDLLIKYLPRKEDGGRYDF